MLTSIDQFLSVSGFIASSSFFCYNSGHNTMRIYFSFSNNEEIETGVKRFSQVIYSELAGK